MIIQPAIVALLLASGLVSAMLVYAASFGLTIIKHWDITSGSDRQLALERRTYLVSSLLSWAFMLQIASLFLFVYTADDLHSRFVGAMCAAGSLNVNGYGYPAFILKIVTCILAGLWLIMNSADNRAYDYPLERKKFVLLLVIVPFVLAEFFLQAGFFLSLRPDIITSCCGSLFSAERTGLPGGMAALPPGPTMIVFWSTLAVLLVSGFLLLGKGRATGVFSFATVAAFLVGAASLISFISLYFYELPTHHCPFCVLKEEYDYVGYALYTTLLGGVVCGGGVGLLRPFRHIGSLSLIVRLFTRRLAFIAMVCYALFWAISGWKMVVADLRLGVL